MAKNAQLQSITMLKNKMSGVLIVVVILGGLFIFLNMMIFSKRSFSNLQSSFSSSTKNQTETLSIFAAASLTAPFTEMGNQFQEIHPDIKLNFNFAGSQQLAQQLSQGAPADIFASADQTLMQAVIDAGRVKHKTVDGFANNSLIVIFPHDNPAQLKHLKDLAEPGIELILADITVPAGNYSVEFLENASNQPAFGPEYKKNVLRNVISYETNVKAVVSKVSLGEADAGIVYKSDALNFNEGEIGILPIPEQLNILSEYFIAPIRGSLYADTASAFIEFVHSPVGQSILGEFGFVGFR